MFFGVLSLVSRALPFERQHPLLFLVDSFERTFTELQIPFTEPEQFSELYH